MQGLINLINSIKQNFAQGIYRSEEAVRVQVCYQILQQLGWNPFSHENLTPEYKVNNLRVDIALHRPRKGPEIFIEVKQPGKCSASGEEQLFGYAANKGGIPMIIFTDGNEWRFYNTYGSGGYESREVKRFLLTEENSDKSAEYFVRYLEYERVKDRQAFVDLQEDHKIKEKEKEAKLAIPEAWNQLIRGEDEMLVEIIVDQVKRSSQGEFAPKKGDVIEFLKGFKPQNVKSKTLPTVVEDTGVHSPPPPGLGSGPLHRYKINGQVIPSKQAKQVYVKALDHVITEYGRFEELKGQKWNNTKSREFGRGYHLSEYENEVPKSAGQKTKLERSGIWVNTNLSAADMSARLVAVGRFYHGVENRKILDMWGSGAVVEFEILTRPTG